MKKTHILLTLLIFSACSSSQTAIDEKDRFIDATKEVSCLLMQNDDLGETLSAANKAQIDEEVRNIFKKHEFDADNDKAFKALSLKYENDKEVIKAINKGIKNCN